MDKQTMLKAFKSLDSKLTQPVKLLMGGGAAMLLVYDFPLSTLDIDALIFQSPVKLSDIETQIIAVSDELKIPKDWLNSYFQTFLFTLPQDYSKRLKNAFHGKKLEVVALGLEDLLVLKCFAGRDKDIPHARALMKKGANLDLVEEHLQKMLEKNISKSQEAIDFFDNLRDDLGL